MQTSGVYLLLGTNLGDRYQNLTNAISMIGHKAGQVLRKSSLYQTAAWGKTEQPDFYNIAIEIQTGFDAEGLLKELLRIETDMGRERTTKWGPRVIDIDILFFNDQVVWTKDLIVPHQGIAFRRFALIPLNELSPDFRHPESGLTIKELLRICPDELEVTLIEPL
jgi:2-amino-4-hydroxy-6-hydroxymethyldihydropteridine diphosphokinase